MYGCNYIRVCCVCAHRDWKEGVSANGNGYDNVVVYDQDWCPAEAVNAEVATDLSAVRRRTRLNWNELPEFIKPYAERTLFDYFTPTIAMSMRLTLPYHGSYRILTGDALFGQTDGLLALRLVGWFVQPLYRQAGLAQVPHGIFAAMGEPWGCA